MHAAVVVLSVLSTACDSLQPGAIDSWKHYQGGGHFSTNAPSLTHDRGLITYASVCSGHGDINVLKRGSSAPVRLTTSDDVEASPMFLPDGTRILYTRERAGFRNIWIMNADGSSPRQLTFGSFVDDPICISRDGSHLLLSRSAPPPLGIGNGLRVTSKVKVIDADSEDLIDVGDVAAMSRDGRTVIYSEANQLWTLDLSRAPHDRERLQGTGWPADVSDDGRSILMVRQDPSKPWTMMDAEIWVVSTATNREWQIADGHSAVLFGPDLRHVLYFSGHDRTAYVVPIHGGKPRRVDGPAGYKTHPIATYDGRGVVVGSIPKGRGESYDAWYLSGDDFGATHIASFDCSDASFVTPR